MLAADLANQIILFWRIRFMRIVLLAFLIAVLSSPIAAQNRQEAVEKFNDLKKQVESLEKTILSPDKKDVENALRENVGVFRLLPREIYDKGFFNVLGGGSYYSFYFRIPDWGYGTDIGFSRNYLLETGFSRCGLISDLGEIPLAGITKEIPSAVSLANYQNAKDLSLCARDYNLAYREGLKLDETTFKIQLPAIVGHTYLVRSVSYDYYDILAAFQVHRKDTDGSLIIFWKQLEQFETPQRNNFQKTQVSDEKILLETKGWSRSDIFPNVKAEVSDGVMTLRGRISKGKLAYAVQLANSAGARKVINLLTVE